MTKRGSISPITLADLVETAKGLAHPARLRLLGMLGSGELCVCQMTAVLELAPSTVSQHLSVLTRGGLVAERKEGKLVFYRLREEPAAGDLLRSLLALVESDVVTRADRAVVARLRRVPIAKLCAAELDLAVIGVRKTAPPPSSARSRSGARTTSRHPGSAPGGAR